ncbi:hypothetical protein EB052_02370 [bacterium]|nr:hypothetical protein [bacterium]
MQPESNNTGKWVVGIIVVIVLIILGFYTMSGSKSSTTDDQAAAPADTSATASALNRIVVTDQFPGNIVYVSSVQLVNPGFVVIHKDASGTPGAIIGSQWFDKGINPGKVNLSSSTVENGVYYAMLHADTDGNGKFDAAIDKPLTDASGNPIMRMFRATASATEVKG